MPENESDVKYAGFGQRMLASVIDSALSVIILLPMGNLFYKIYGHNEIQLMIARGEINITNIPEQQLMDFLYYQLASFTWQNIIMALAVIIFWIYRGATPGKMILKMKIVDSKTYGAPSKKQLIIRYLSYFISFLPVGLGFVWIYYDKKRQGFHDKLASTVVVVSGG